MALFHPFRKSWSFHGERFQWLIYTPMLIQWVPSLAPDRAAKELRFFRGLSTSPGDTEYQIYSAAPSPKPPFTGAVKSEHRRFHFIFNYFVLQNTRLCHGRSWKTENSNKEYLLGALSLRPAHRLIQSGAKRFPVNQGCGGLFFGPTPFLLRQF